MKKLSLISGILMILTEIIFAQDLIFKRNGEIIEGKVLEINESDIKYKKKDDPNSPMYSVDKTNILKIRYANGKVESYGTGATGTLIDDETLKKIEFDSTIKKRKNIIGWDIAQFIYVSGGLAYERFFGKNSQFSIRIPFSFGFYYIGNEENLSYGDAYYIYQKGKIVGGALEFNYYPLGMGKFKYFMGPYFEYGIFAYTTRPYYYYYPYPSYTDPLRYDGQHIAGGINNGFIYHITKNLTLTGTFGLGMKKDETVMSTDKIVTQVKFNLIFGIKF